MVLNYHAFLIRACLTLKYRLLLKFYMLNQIVISTHAYRSRPLCHMFSVAWHTVGFQPFMMALILSFI